MHANFNTEFNSPEGARYKNPIRKRSLSIRNQPFDRLRDRPSTGSGTALRQAVFFLTCVVIAGFYGAYSTKNKKILFIQSAPAIVALALVVGGR